MHHPNHCKTIWARPPINLYNNASNSKPSSSNLTTIYNWQQKAISLPFSKASNHPQQWLRTTRRLCTTGSITKTYKWYTAVHSNQHKGSTQIRTTIQTWSDKRSRQVPLKSITQTQQLPQRQRQYCYEKKRGMHYDSSNYAIQEKACTL